MIKNEGARVWVNRIVAFLVGGLAVLAVMSIVAVAPVKSENAALKTKLDDVQNGAARLLSEAKTLVDNRNYGGAQTALKTLFEKQPGSKEEAEGRKLYAAIDVSVKELDSRWEAAAVAIRADWEAKAAKDLRAKLEDARLQQEKDMADTLSKEWDRAKGDVRVAWENTKK